MTLRQGGPRSATTSSGTARRFEEIVLRAQFTAAVVVRGQRILRTGAKFNCPWSVVGVADVDEELVDKSEVDDMAGAGRPPHRAGRLASGERAACSAGSTALG